LEAGQKKTILNAFPAQELVRVAYRIQPRDWETRWGDAGGEFHEGRMVALKTDDIWTRISRFGTPWPPFDFNSGMGLKEIDREEAIRLELMTDEEDLEPIDQEFNDGLEASVRDLQPEFKEALKTIFGDQIDLDGDVAKWRAAA
jgi:hypothetical protein